MREKWARAIALLTGGLVLSLAVIFAYTQNPATWPFSAPTPTQSFAPAPSAEVTQDMAQIEAGRVVYNEQNCARCHAIAGRGNPSSPLDGVGSRLSAEQILRWIDPSRESGTAANFQARHANRASTLTESQRAALLGYLRSLKDTGHRS